MKAFIVDPFTQLITPTKYDGNYETISKHIGGSCRMFTAVRLYHTHIHDYDYLDDHVYIDDEGLYVDDQHFWMHANYPLPLAGRGLILGGTPDGDSTDVNTKLATVMDDIKMIGNRFELQIMMAFSKAHAMPSPDGYLEDYRPFVWKHHDSPIIDNASLSH